MSQPKVISSKVLAKAGLQNAHEGSGTLDLGILAAVANPLLHKPEPKLAFVFDNSDDALYNYEADGNNVVLISPSNITKYLEGPEAQYFWAAMDRLENETIEATQAEYLQQLQTLLRSLFDKDVKTGSVFDRRQNDRRKEERAYSAERRQSVIENAKTWAQAVKKVGPDVAADFAGYYLRQSPDGGEMLATIWPQFERKIAKLLIQVDASHLKKASVTFIAGVEWNDAETVNKFRFTTNKAKAGKFSRLAAAKIRAQLPEFQLNGKYLKAL